MMRALAVASIALERLRPAGGHACGFQYLGIFLWLVALGFVVLAVLPDMRRDTSAAAS